MLGINLSFQMIICFIDSLIFIDVIVCPYFIDSNAALIISWHLFILSVIFFFYFSL